MNKPKGNKNTKPSNADIIKNISITFPNGTSKDEITDILASAIVKAETIRKENEEKELDEEQRRWQNLIGLKDFSNRKVFGRTVCTFFNSIGVLIRALFIKQKDLTGERNLTVCMKYLIEKVLNFLCLLNCVLPVSFFITKQWILFIITTLYAVLVDGIVIRLSKIEIDKIRDRKHILELFTAVMTVATVFISIIAIIVSIMIANRT